MNAILPPDAGEAYPERGLPELTAFVAEADSATMATSVKYTQCCSVVRLGSSNSRIRAYWQTIKHPKQMIRQYPALTQLVDECLAALVRREIESLQREEEDWAFYQKRMAA